MVDFFWSKIALSNLIIRFFDFIIASPFPLDLNKLISLRYSNLSAFITNLSSEEKAFPSPAIILFSSLKISIFFASNLKEFATAKVVVTKKIIIAMTSY